MPRLLDPIADTGTVAARPSRAWGDTRPARGEWAGIGLTLVLVAWLAVARWSGVLPFGSDNDEYRMLADALYETGKPVIGGVEGSKYPLGWSLVVGGLDRLGLDATVAPMALNLLLVAVTVVVVWLVGRRLGAVAGLAGAVGVAVSSSLWGSVYVIMPDAALTATVALGLLVMVSVERARDVVTTTALALAAALLKTVGVVLGGALTVAAFLVPATRRWSWAPVTAAVGVTGLSAIWAARFPEHTTGYGATFWLVDPYDAALGEIAVTDLPARIVGRLDEFLTDAAKAVVGPQVPSTAGIVIVVVLTVAAIVAFRRWRLPLTAFVLTYAVVLAAWPYRSDRFGLPLLPIAGVGLAALVGWVGRRSGSSLVAGVVAVALLVPHVVGQVGRIAEEGQVEEDTFAPLAADTAELVAWMDQNIPADEAIASFDYREIAYRADRVVLPLGYTTDGDALLAASAGRDARWLVVLRGLYGRREARATDLLTSHPDRFELVHSTGRADVYRIIVPERDT